MEIEWAETRKEKERQKSKKGDASNEVRKGTFLTSFDNTETSTPKHPVDKGCNSL
jgi:hypothetical protein